LLSWIDRLRNGDLVARDELLREIGERLQALTHQMLGRFPGVRRWADADDVLQNAQLRLLRSLHHVRPDSTRAFFGLAAKQIRRELLDLARRYYGPQGIGANHANKKEVSCLADSADESDDMGRWTLFHEEVAKLPAKEHEVVCLVFYHGWKQAEVAERLQVTVRTVQRRWQTSVAKLRRRLGKTLDPCGRRNVEGIMAQSAFFRPESLGDLRHASNGTVRSHPP
jgi:RNA polymerase sigma-70 factor (ECF subfamily)